MMIIIINTTHRGAFQHRRARLWPCTGQTYIFNEHKHERKHTATASDGVRPTNMIDIESGREGGDHSMREVYRERERERGERGSEREREGESALLMANERAINANVLHIRDFV